MEKECRDNIDCPLAGEEGRRFWKEWGEFSQKQDDMVKNITELVRQGVDRNGRLGKAEIAIARIMTIGSLAVVLIPILIKIFWP